MDNTTTTAATMDTMAAEQEAPFVNGWFTLVVARDRSCAFIKKIVRHAGQGKPITADDILKKLKKEKVTYGIDRTAITELVQSIDNNEIPEEQVIIARGDFEHGLNGSLQWCVGGDEEESPEIIVTPDMQIAIRELATKGRPGKNVYGKKVQPRPGYDVQLQAGAGICCTEDEKNGRAIYKTAYAGVLKRDDSRVCVDPHLRVSKDTLQAHMDIRVAGFGETNRKFTPADILQTLEAAGIKYGVIEDNINTAFSGHGESGLLVENVLVAEGKAPVDGKDAVIDWHVDPAAEHPVQRTVLPKQLLAIRTPPTGPQTGINVYGEEVTGKEGAVNALESGPGTVAAEVDGRWQYRAQWLGDVHYDGSIVSINTNVTVSDDKMQANMVLFPHAETHESGDVSLAHVKTSLAEQGITFGIREKAISAALEQAMIEQKPYIELLVAEGKAPVNGKDAVIKWCLDVHEKDPVKRAVIPDQLIAIRIPPIEPQAGFTIYGEELPGQEGAVNTLETGTGVTVTEVDKQFEFRAQWMGDVHYDGLSLSVNAHVTIADDKMEVTMGVYPLTEVQGDKKSLLEYIKASLAKQGITFGIRDKAVNTALEQAMIEQKPYIVLLVAAGRPPRHGVAVQLVLEQQLTAGKLLDNGKIDFYERSYPWNVKANDIIGHVIPPQPEENGMDVTGAVLQARPVPEMKLLLEGIKKGVDSKLCAQRNGVLLVNGLNLKVSDSLVIDGDICQKTGNIHSDTTVVVKGYVVPGFVLEAKGDAVVQNNVEDATVHSNANIIIKEGVRGSHSNISADGDIATAFAENAKLVAKGDINVKTSLIGCDTFSGQVVKVGNAGAQKSTIIGGVTRAVKGIEAANLGSEGFHKTVIEAGLGTEFMQRFKEVTGELDAKKTLLNNLLRVFEHYQQHPASNREELLQKVVNTRDAAEKEYNELLVEYNALQIQMEEAKKVKVQAYRHVYPGVTIHILDKIHEVTETRNTGAFRLDGEHIIFDSTL